MYKIAKNPQSHHGFDLIHIDENGFITRTEITSKTSDNYFRLNLPQNYNIKYLAIRQIEANLDKNGEYIIEPRATRMASSSTTKAPTLSWMDYITDEEKSTIEAIKARALKAMQVDKIKAQIKALEELLGKVE